MSPYWVMILYVCEVMCKFAGCCLCWCAWCFECCCCAPDGSPEPPAGATLLGSAVVDLPFTAAPEDEVDDADEGGDDDELEDISNSFDNACRSFF